MTTREKPFCVSGPKWIADRLRDKSVLAPLTGQDWSALKAFFHLVELYGRADDHGRNCALQAMQLTVAAMQPSVRDLAKAGIPHVLDWGDEDRIWQQISVDREALDRVLEYKVTTHPIPSRTPSLSLPVGLFPVGVGKSSFGGPRLNAWPKKCSCCGLLYYPGVWTELSFVGYDGDEQCRLELRNCTCGSTLSVEVEATGLPWTLAGELADVLRNDARDLEGFPPAYHWPPQPRRETSPDDLVEAKRLHDIADELIARARAFDAPSEHEAA